MSQTLYVSSDDVTDVTDYDAMFMLNYQIYTTKKIIE